MEPISYNIQGLSRVDVGTTTLCLRGGEDRSHDACSANARLVSRIERVRSSRDAELRGTSIEDGKESLQEGHAIDEVQAFPRVGTKVTDDEEDVVRITANCRVQLDGKSVTLLQNDFMNLPREATAGRWE